MSGAQKARMRSGRTKLVIKVSRSTIYCHSSRKVSNLRLQILQKEALTVKSTTTRRHSVHGKVLCRLLMQIFINHSLVTWSRLFRSLALPVYLASTAVAWLAFRNSHTPSIQKLQHAAPLKHPSCRTHWTDQIFLCIKDHWRGHFSSTIQLREEFSLTRLVRGIPCLQEWK